MSNILQIAYTTEGSTDKRFLGSIIEKTFESLLFEGNTEIEIHPPVHVNENGTTFNDKIQTIAINYSYFHVICVHCDSDARTNVTVIADKIDPAFELVRRTEDTCKNLVAVIPVQMTEAWMLADIDLFLKEISTDKSCNELNLPCHPRLIESIANPKVRIEEALREAQMNTSRRRSKLTISDLYSPIAHKLNLQQLEQLPSFRHFKENVRNSLISLNYLY